MENSLRLAAIIPAAGTSSRMGAFKPFLPFGSSTVIETAVKNALSVADKAITVLGKRGDEIRELLEARFGERLLFAENTDYASTDMLTSVKIALREMDACDAFFISPADMPLIPPSVYQALALSFCRDDEILIPVVDEKKGHPPLIAARLIPAILAYDGGEGLRGFYRGHKVREIAAADTGILKDLDTPQDYLALKNTENNSK